jgi:hypothetical protein
VVFAQVVVMQLLPPHGATVPTTRSGISDDSFLQAAPLSFDFLAVSAFFLPWSSRKCVCVDILSFLAMFGRRTVLVETLDPARSLSFLVLKTKELG